MSIHVLRKLQATASDTSVRPSESGSRAFRHRSLDLRQQPLSRMETWVRAVGEKGMEQRQKTPFPGHRDWQRMHPLIDTFYGLKTP